jgi:MFS family permease
MSGSPVRQGEAGPGPEQKSALDSSAPSRTAWLVFATAGLFIFYQLILQSLPSVIREGLVVDFSLTDAGFGSLSATSPPPMLQVPAGHWSSRFGSRRLLIAGLVLCIVASFITAISQDIWHVTAARVLMGLGAAPPSSHDGALAGFPRACFPF